jgi:hypothetical protein
VLEITVDRRIDFEHEHEHENPKWRERPVRGFKGVELFNNRCADRNQEPGPGAGNCALHPDN